MPSETDILFTLFGTITVYRITLSAALLLLGGLVLLCLSGIISASEEAFVSLDSQTMSELEESEGKRDRHILRLLKTPRRLLATILVAQIFLNIAAIVLLGRFSSLVFGFEHAPLLGFFLQVFLLALLLLLFVELIPKLYAMRYTRKMAFRTAFLLSALERLFGPFVGLLVNSTSVMHNHLSKYDRSKISIDELVHALELSAIQSNEKDTEMLEGIIKFGNIRVVDIMTSRLDMVVVDVKTNYKQLLDIIVEAGYSRIPVFSGTRDNIKGLIYSKDLLPYLDKQAGFRWQSLIRHPYYVPETKMIDDLLLEFQENRVHLALVVDEYGGISGLVTLEDILEEIVGDISDEYDEDEVLYTKLDNHTFVFEAKILLNDFFKITGIKDSEFAPVLGDVETLAGLILELKGEIPSRNERLDYGRYVFEIMSVDNRRIKKVKLHIKDDFKKSEENE